MVEVRIASGSDAQAMLDIYKPYVYDTAISFETELPSVEQFEQRINTCLEKYPWIVCTVNNQIAAYVYASKHREREAYQWTCECSVYVDDKFKGKGIAKELYACLFWLLKFQGFRNVYAGITMPNIPSEKLHAACGFELFAVYDNIGYKLGSWHKVGWWKLQLNGFDPKPAPPQKFSQLDRLAFEDRFREAGRRIGERVGS